MSKNITSKNKFQKNIRSKNKFTQRANIKLTDFIYTKHGKSSNEAC